MQSLTFCYVEIVFKSLAYHGNDGIVLNLPRRSCQCFGGLPEPRRTRFVRVEVELNFCLRCSRILRMLTFHDYKMSVGVKAGITNQNYVRYLCNLVPFGMLSVAKCIDMVE